jgi:Thioredoxin
MPISTSVVTPVRFALGLSYAEFLKQATVNHDKFAQSYETVPLTAEDLAFFRKAKAHPHGPARILALAEAWCGDVYRELPTAVRIADDTGMELRIFFRDQNPDIMDEFLLGEKKARAIPVFVFYTQEHHYITHWQERSVSAYAGIKTAQDAVKTEMNLPESTTMGSLPDAERQAFLRAFIAKVEPPPTQWRIDAIREIRENMARAMGIPNAG